MKFQGTFEKRCFTTPAPSELPFVTASLSMFFAITNIPGNLLVVLAVVIDPNKDLQSPFNWLVANLALTDLIVGTITNPLSVYIHLKEGLKLKINLNDVRAIHLSYFMSCTASVLILSTLAVERYLAVRNPHTYRNRLSKRRIWLTVTGIWLISVGVSQVYFVSDGTTYAFIFANTVILLAIVIVCVTYIQILREFRERSQNRSNQNNQSAISNRTAPTVSSSVQTSSGGNDDVNETSHSFDTSASAVPGGGPPISNYSSVLSNRARLMETKVRKMFLVVLTALLCCYGPSTIMIYVMNFCESCSCSTLHWLRDMQFIFVIMNSSVNFYCYALKSPRFRNAFLTILRRRRQRAQPHQSYINRVRRSVSNAAGQSEEGMYSVQCSREIAHSNPVFQNDETSM